MEDKNWEDLRIPPDSGTTSRMAPDQNQNDFLGEQTWRFALQVVDIYKALKEHRHYSIAEQFVYAGTGVGSNYREGQHGSSSKEMVRFWEIAQREVREAGYWLGLIREGHLLPATHDAELATAEATRSTIYRALTKAILTLKNRRP